ncbi:hypothetical protein V499_09463 [Pseudogymnoascus sp. VKM F-103]|nr:hypothetical protein V499_09463 [Pseudogymnoascus sp. VKM F-103]
MPLPPILEPRAVQSPSVVGEVLGAIGTGLFNWAEKMIWQSLGLGESESHQNNTPVLHTSPAVVLRIPTTEYGRLSAVLPAGDICYMGTGRPAKVTRPTGMHWMAEFYLFKPKLPVEAGDAERELLPMPMVIDGEQQLIFRCREREEYEDGTYVFYDPRDNHAALSGLARLFKKALLESFGPGSHTYAAGLWQIALEKPPDRGSELACTTTTKT